MKSGSVASLVLHKLAFKRKPNALVGDVDTWTWIVNPNGDAAPSAIYASSILMHFRIQIHFQRTPQIEHSMHLRILNNLLCGASGWHSIVLLLSASLSLIENAKSSKTLHLQLSKVRARVLHFNHRFGKLKSPHYRSLTFVRDSQVVGLVSRMLNLFLELPRLTTCLGI